MNALFSETSRAVFDNNLIGQFTSFCLIVICSALLIPIECAKCQDYNASERLRIRDLAKPIQELENVSTRRDRNVVTVAYQDSDEADGNDQLDNSFTFEFLVDGGLAPVDDARKVLFNQASFEPGTMSVEVQFSIVPQQLEQLQFSWTLSQPGSSSNLEIAAQLVDPTLSLTKPNTFIYRVADWSWLNGNAPNDIELTVDLQIIDGQTAIASMGSMKHVIVDVVPPNAKATYSLTEYEIEVEVEFEGLLPESLGLSSGDFRFQRQAQASAAIALDFRNVNSNVVALKTKRSLKKGTYEFSLLGDKFVDRVGNAIVSPIDQPVLALASDIIKPSSRDLGNQLIIDNLKATAITDLRICRPDEESPECKLDTEINKADTVSDGWMLFARFTKDIEEIIGRNNLSRYYLVIGQDRRLLPRPKNPILATENGTYEFGFAIDDLSWLSKYDGTNPTVKLEVEVDTYPVTRLEGSMAVPLRIDTTLPKIVSHRPFVSDATLHIEIIFLDDDVAKLVESEIKLYEVGLTENSRTKQGVIDIVKNVDSGNPRIAVINTGLTTAGSFEIRLDSVIDGSGNDTGIISLPVSIASDVPQSLSPVVEFPEYLSGRTGNDDNRRFNPADFVETRVARLFYFRDAHRVAQIINRITQSYKRAAVNQAEQRYESAKREFEQLVIERKGKESNAVRLAQDTRTAERELEELYQKQNALRREQASRSTDPSITNFELARRNASVESELLDDVNDWKLERADTEIELKRTRFMIDELKAEDPTIESNRELQRLEERVVKLNRRKERLDRDIQLARRRQQILHTDTRLRDENLTVEKIATSELSQIRSQIEIQESIVQAGRSAEDDAREVVRQAVLNEELAAKTQFDLLASARNKDPDTYAPANIDSKDPVARVSVSVIGEGLIQLRGPLNGINKIRLMMHQIDSPRGQIKLDINTIQINGEDRRRMEKVAGNVESNIALGRHLTMQSLELLRRSIVEEATRVAQSQCQGEPTQQSRDQKYMYAFFGEDFVNELYDMDSEFLKSENKILSLHSMDVVSPSNALFIFLLARNDVQQNICNTFFQLVESELPEIEWEHRSALEMFPHQTKRHLPFSNKNRINANTKNRVYRNASQRYKFRNFRTFFQNHAFGQDVLNPTQREFIRLAQIFKSQMIAEQEVKQRIVERALIEDEVLEDIKDESRFQIQLREALFDALQEIPGKLKRLQDEIANIKSGGINLLSTADFRAGQRIEAHAKRALELAQELLITGKLRLDDEQSNQTLFRKIDDLKEELKAAYHQAADSSFKIVLEQLHAETANIEQQLLESSFSTGKAKEYSRLLKKYRRPNNERKLLDFLIEEKLEKQIELLEGTRAQISVMDNYIKRLMTALEDDFQTQFYDPSFIRMRSAASREVVNFSQAERTTLLMNNRDLGIVQPSATMEFDLPRRDILIVETLDTAKAIAQDYGALLQDPTYLAVFDMLGGGQVPNKTQKVLPGLPSLTDEYSLGLSESSTGSAGSVLQSRVQDPAIYQFETGTGFEVRPVIQPDGHSLVYDFHYMYTSQVREPVRADEKHLGRVKRHFINTQVQTSSFEMREVGRYLVALKAARTGSGVPGLQDIPIVGRAFKPAPSAESSLQQNIVFAKSTVYPTLYDLMGLRWARQVVDLDHTNLQNDEYVVRERRRALENHVFDKTGALVDEVLGIDEKSYHYRPDLYHPQENQRNYQHPNGYHDQNLEFRYQQFGDHHYRSQNDYPNQYPVDHRSPRHQYSNDPNWQNPHSQDTQMNFQHGFHPAEGQVYEQGNGNANLSNVPNANWELRQNQPLNNGRLNGDAPAQSLRLNQQYLDGGLESIEPQENLFDSNGLSQPRSRQPRSRQPRSINRLPKPNDGSSKFREPQRLHSASRNSSQTYNRYR